VDFDSKFEIADCNFDHNEPQSWKELYKMQETATGIAESGTNGFIDFEEAA
jgi:hypothetical protein